jgi:hypothetical protein
VAAWLVPPPEDVAARLELPARDDEPPVDDEEDDDEEDDVAPEDEDELDSPLLLPVHPMPNATDTTAAFAATQRMRTIIVPSPPGCGVTPCGHLPDRAATMRNGHRQT